MSPELACPAVIYTLVTPDDIFILIFMYRFYDNLDMGVSYMLANPHLLSHSIHYSCTRLQEMWSIFKLYSESL